ncbi:hypothetical protein L3X38_002970 [Prunus dulcis]|uniref:Uncharacterized protein n=1 Tax=Prunus dulcis TaxID=3755 RepID=A0AAD4ZL80_PRUDU|nr:hypothetical protein L3X38_002970 [Prunus dulcis]
MPTRTLQNISPYTALFGQNPNYQKLRIFGAYQCLDLSTNRLFLSHHVQFDESTFPFATHDPIASRVSSSSLSTWSAFLPSLVSVPVHHATTPHPPSPPPINSPPSQGPQPLPSLSSEEFCSPAPFSPSSTHSDTPSGTPSSTPSNTSSGTPSGTHSSHQTLPPLHPSSTSPHLPHLLTHLPHHHLSLLLPIIIPWLPALKTTSSSPSISMP